MKNKLLSLLVVAATASTLVFTTVPDVQAKSYSRSSSPSSSFKSTPSRPSNVKVNTVSNTRSQTSFSTVNNATTPTKNVRASFVPTPTRGAVTTAKPSNAIVTKEVYKAPNPTNAPTEVRYESRYDTTGKLYSVRVEAPIGSSISVPLHYFPSTVTTSPVIVYDNDTSFGSIIWGTIGTVFIIFIFFIIVRGN